MDVVVIAALALVWIIAAFSIAMLIGRAVRVGERQDRRSFLRRRCRSEASAATTPVPEEAGAR